MKDLTFRIILVLFCLAAFSTVAQAQFKEEAFSQSYNDPADTLASRDSIDQMWSFKEFFRGVAKHDSTLKIGSMFAGSMVFIGAEQYYNKHYWKIPIIYAGLGGTAYMGFKYRKEYKASKSAYELALEADPDTPLTPDERAKKMSAYMFASAGLIYWGSLMDGVVNYKRDVPIAIGCAVVLLLFATPVKWLVNRVTMADLPVVYLCGIAGTMMVLLVAKMIGRLPLISYWGRYSIMVLCSHNLFLNVLCPLLKPYLSEGMLLFVSFVAAMLASHLMIPLMKRFLPHVTAQKDLIKV